MCLISEGRFLTIFWSSSAASCARSRSLLSTTKIRPWRNNKTHHFQNKNMFQSENIKQSSFLKDSMHVHKAASHCEMLKLFRSDWNDQEYCWKQTLGFFRRICRAVGATQTGTAHTLYRIWLLFLNSRSTNNNSIYPTS